ncbi:MAG: YicC family protein [Rubritepida sp.]|nr:YicC family protein [Rubritepida sp.]
MTGFARDSFTLPDGTQCVWELRSVNGRGLDVRLRLPAGLDGLENAIREAAGKRLKRGNIQAGLQLKQEQRPALALDQAMLDRMVALALEVARQIPGAAPPRAEALLSLPGVIRAEIAEPDEAALAARQAAVLAGFQRGLEGLVAARAEEGARLHAILTTLLDEIAALCGQAQREAADQPAAQRNRLMENLALLLDGDTRARIPEERLAQEVAMLAQRSDVREELDRLGAHLGAARALLATGDGAGRKLDFLTQEFAREANTLCSKSASVALTSTGLALKAAIERLKEQAANVE